MFKVLVLSIFFSLSAAHAIEAVNSTMDQSLDETAQAIPSGERCSELKPGESLRVYNTRQNTEALIPRNFTVTRDPNHKNIYEVKFPLSFSTSLDLLTGEHGRYTATHLSPNDRDRDDHRPAGDVALYVAAQQSANAMASRIRECFKQFDGKLRDPSGVEIRLRTDFEEENKTKTTVRLTPTGERSHSRGFARDISCTSIAHEAMHWLGLADGYPGDEDGYPCRAIDPTRSIMHNHRETFGDKYEMTLCLPETGVPPALIQAGANEDLSKKCPDPKSSVYTAPPMTVSADYIELLKANPQYVMGNVYYKKLPANAPTLFPAQSRMITLPLCNRANKNYTECAKFSQVPPEKCTPLPFSCRVEEYLK